VSRFRSAGLFLGLSVVWGAAFVAIKAGLAYFPPVLFAAVRYDVAGVLMVAYAAYATDHPVPRGRQEWWVTGVAGGAFMIAGYHALLFVGEQFTTSAVAAIVVGLNPVLTTAFARGLLPDERLAPVGVGGLLVGLSGVVVLANPDPANLLGSATRGPALVFGATASFALGSVLARRSDAGVPIETMEAWAMLLGAGLLHVASVVLGESPEAVAFTPEAALALSYLAVVASALGFLAYFELLELVGPVELNLVSYVAPVVAAAVGVALLGEAVTPRAVAGFLLIVAGFALVKRRELRATLRRPGPS
jgi:drug/metabolite transporter (DMT)-like permease